MRRLHGRAALLVLFALVFLLSAYKVGGMALESRRREEEFRQLQRLVAEAAPAPRPQEAPEGGWGQGPMLEKYAALYRENPDVFGWVQIEGTRLNYPVMHTPQEPEYYLRRSFYKNSSEGGVPFLAGDCTREGKNYLIYGHNMNDGSMFAALLSYARESFWREHPAVCFDTLYDTGRYAVVAAFYPQIPGQDEQEGFRYYRYTDLTRPDAFEEYLRQVKQAALYDTGVTPEYGDQLLTLSTCSYHAADGRFVVVAVKKEA